jgi:ABC-type multidrug transport system ATPase subunit
MRTVLAKALLSRPQLLLLDEPTASLDPETAERVRGLLSSLPRQGVTLLWTSHNMAEVERRCTRVVFLHRGRVFLDGPPRELARRAGEVLVSYRRPNGAPPGEIAENGWQTVAVPGEPEAAALIAQLQNQGSLEGLEVRHPTLEDLFLRLAREQLEPNGDRVLESNGGPS